MPTFSCAPLNIVCRSRTSSRPIRLPARREAWVGIARTLGYDHVDAFAEALHSHTSAVRSVFDRLLRSSDGQREKVYRDLSAFRDPEQRCAHADRAA